MHIYHGYMWSIFIQCIYFKDAEVDLIEIGHDRSSIFIQCIYFQMHLFQRCIYFFEIDALDENTFWV